jgi:type I restriction enzyme M protein
MGNHSDKQGWNDAPESVIISQKVIPYLRNLGYRYIDSEVRVPMGSRMVAADVLVYLDEERSFPYIVVEAKRRLHPQITLLDTAVQQAFAIAAALGERVRYLMITDGARHHWFERSAEGRSLIQLSAAPETPREVYQLPLLEPSLAPVTDPEQFLRILQSIIDVLRQEGIVFGLRVAIELNRILIAKLHDERTAKDGEPYRFSSEGDQAKLVASRIKQLYQEAIADLGGPTIIEEGIWSLSSEALLTAAKILEPYALTSVSSSVRGRFFWQVFSGLLSGREGQYASPVPLAEFLVQLVDPIPGERVIDPACGTGLFLIEVLEHVKHQVATGQVPLAKLPEDPPVFLDSIMGIELNAEVAELAATNLALNNLPPKQVIKANTLDRKDLEASGVELGAYDVVILDPPIGVVRDEYILNQFEIPQLGVRTSLEVLFAERAVELLCPGGRLALLIPDSFLSSPVYRRAREWLLHRVVLRAIISLPPEAFAPVGHSGKATILLLENERPSLKGEESVLVADVQTVGYDRFGRPTEGNDLPELLEVIRHFHTMGHAVTRLEEGRLRVWQVAVNDLNAERLDVTWFDPQGYELTRALKRGRYPAVKLEKLVDIRGGRNFKEYVERGPTTAVVIQAGTVRDLEITLDLSSARYVSSGDFERVERAQIKAGDVLVTTTGQYLGRAAVVDSLPGPAVASGAVTILRPWPKGEVDPFFLAAVISSELGKRQIASRQAAATAQPYIRRADLGEVLIPMPPLSKQRNLAERIRRMLIEARELSRRAQTLESTAKDLVVTEFLGVSDDE